MQKEELEIALQPTQFRLPDSDKMTDLRTLDETVYAAERSRKASA